MELNRPLLRRYLGSYAFSMFGTGLWMPLNAIYLVDKFGLPTTQVGLYYTVASVFAICANLAAGTLADRYGPLRPFVAAGLLQAFGISILVLAPSAPFAFVAAAVAGLGNGAFFAVQASVLTRLFGKENLSTVFGRQYQVMNLAIGVGALLLGGLVQTWGFTGYAIGFGLNALSYAVHVLNVAGPLRKLERAERLKPTGANPPRRSYPLRPYLDRRFRPLIILQFCIVFFGYAQLEAAYPVVFKESGHLPIWAITAYVAVNCVAVVGLQPWANRYVARSGGPAAVRLALASWIVAAIPALALAYAGPLPVRVALIAIFGIVFAVGEVLVAPSVQPMAAKAAPEGQLGVYTASVSNLFGIGMMLGPSALLPIFGAFGAGTYWSVVVLGAVIGILTTRMLPRLLKDNTAVPQAPAKSQVAV